MEPYPLDPTLRYLNRMNEPLIQQLYKEGAKYKTYPRCERVYLEKPSLPAQNLVEVLTNRTSSRVFAEPLEVSQLAGILFWMMGEREVGGKKKRAHPSGGGKYPLEAYVVAANVTGLARGVYHYNIKEHSLEHLPATDVDLVLRDIGLEESGISNPGVVCLFSSIKQRSAGKYGPLATKLALIEAGHIGQNGYLAAGSFGVGCCALGLNENVPELNHRFGLDGINEALIYGLVFGGGVQLVFGHLLTMGKDGGV